MALPSKVFTYQAELVWRGGRKAAVTSGDLPELTVAPPEEFAGGGDDHWSPEHLYLASLESCTMLSFLAHCAHNDLDVEEYSSAATGSLQRRADDQRYAFTHVTVVVRVRMARRPRRGRARADGQGRARLLHLGLDQRHRRDGLADHGMSVRASSAAAVSTLADTRAAAEEVAARVRDGLAGAPADLAFLFLSPEHVADAEEAAAAVVAVLEPGALAGATGEAVIGTARELEGVPAMSLLATSLPAGAPASTT